MQNRALSDCKHSKRDDTSYSLVLQIGLCIVQIGLCILALCPCEGFRALTSIHAHRAMAALPSARYPYDRTSLLVLDPACSFRSKRMMSSIIVSPFPHHALTDYLPSADPRIRSAHTILSLPSLLSMLPRENHFTRERGHSIVLTPCTRICSRQPSSLDVISNVLGRPHSLAGYVPQHAV